MTTVGTLAKSLNSVNELLLVTFRKYIPRKIYMRVHIGNRFESVSRFL